MMDLKMDVYTQSLELIGMLNIQKSIIWEDKAFTAGSFSVESLISDESKALLVPENIIWIEGETAGIIEYISKESGKDGPYITAKGSTLTGILARRILWGRYDLTGTPPAIMHQLVNDCCINPTRGNVEARKIPGLVLLDAPTGGESIRVQKTGGTLLEALEQLGETYGVAFGVHFNPAVPQMEFWTRWGQNRSINQTANDPVFYSTELDDVLSSEYSYSSQDYRNAALVAGGGEGNDRIMVVVESDVPEPPAPPEPATYTITLSVDPQGGGVVSGGGTVNEGASVSVTAAPSTNYTFSGWRENGEIVSTNATYTFSATRDRALTAAFAVVGRLPAGYTELEYVESTNGNCIIDTGQKLAPDINTVIDFEPLFSPTSTDATIIWNNYSGVWYATEWLSYRTLSGVVGNIASNGSPWKTVNPNTTPRRMIVEMDNGAGAITADEISVSFSSKGVYSASSPNVFLFGTSTGSATLKGRLYSCKIYLGSSAARDFAPCKNPSGEVGLYDLVEERFYGSSGTGTFTAGPAV